MLMLQKKLIDWVISISIELWVLVTNILSGVATRGNLYKLVPDRSKYELRRHYFTHRIVSVWNSLPDIVVSAESVNSFKSRLDKFWSMHEFVYDYRASPLAAGSV